MMMARYLANILLVVSLVFILGHSFVPHRHQQNITNTQSLVTVPPAAPENSLLSFLRTVFSLDLGANHLQDYRAQNAVDDFNFFTVFILAVFHFVFTPLRVKGFTYLEKHTQLPVSLFVFSDKPLRAPPFLA